MSQDDNFWFGTFVLAIFIALCIVGGYLIVRFQNWRLSLHWRPLLPLFDPVSLASGDGGGPGGLLRGKHRGHSFVASMAQAVAADSDGNDRFNEFTLALLEVSGSRDWCVVQHAGGFLGLGKAEWRVETESPELADALRAAGVVEAALALGGEDYTVAKTGPMLAYSRASRRLVSRRDTGKAFAPSPDTLRHDMAALLHWAEVNARLNVATAKSSS